MCAAFEFKGKAVKPGRKVAGSGAAGPVLHVWAGFAREEILSWWENKGALLIDIPATRFAERSQITGKLVWDEMPAGLVIRGLVDHQTRYPLIKIVTRSSNPVEIERFQHPRMPLLQKPLFPPLPDGFFDAGSEPDLFL